MPIPVTTMRRASIRILSLEEIEQALSHQRARHQRTEQLGLAFGVHLVDQLESRQRSRRLRTRDHVGELPRLAEHTPRSDAAIDEPDPMRFRCAHRLTRQDHLEGLRTPDESGQPADAPETRDEAERGLGEAEAGTRAADTQVAGERDLETAPQAEPVDGGDERLREPEQRVEQSPADTRLADRLLRGREERE